MACVGVFEGTYSPRQWSGPAQRRKRKARSSQQDQGAGGRMRMSVCRVVVTDRGEGLEGGERTEVRREGRVQA